MKDHKTLLQQRGIEEENRARNQITVSPPTRSQTVIANANAALTGPSEVAFNVCCLCVYCPLCVLWCCIKQPCTIGWRAILKARRQLSGCGGCGRSFSRRVLATDYSSFSDIDSDDVNCKAHNCSKGNR
ncbi:hypothetical protein EUTSA_v10011863mg [Eutrema salsugineum]|uniref:Uncharacterized protein n=1 Tax=Eutrema salsugineum TaxID=72664 RepID=V4KHI9_EUTSA|nr:uncharacterized protein LOC18011302 [Eutrema salsugineum]ESQ30649.1 hypothetical protein EUTSA_v10011863mg [Eutrema salsugineum]